MLARCKHLGINMFPVYKKYGNVPLYIYPDNNRLRSLIEKYGSVKKAKQVLRSTYRCFISENSYGRGSVVIDVDVYEEPPVSPVPVLLNVMCRTSKHGRHLVTRVVRELEKMNVKINPYTYASKGSCIGFYPKSFRELDNIMKWLVDRGLIEACMIVNGVWYARFGVPVNLVRLMETGVFILSASKSFKLVKGVIGRSSVSVFHTGTVRITNAYTPEQAQEVLGKVYGLMKRYNAIEGVA